jgi:exodeoxyribonuclease V beta subunit
MDLSQILRGDKKKHLIEASAGTGKTYTLIELYLKLLIEKKIFPLEIIVLTFTRAATFELRRRIKQRVQQEIEVQSDPEIVLHLQMAEKEIDDAPISTIHGFCQDVLRNFAFESSAFFEWDIIEDDEIILKELIPVFWKRKLSKESLAMVQWLSRESKLEVKHIAEIINLVIHHPKMQFLLPEQKYSVGEEKTKTALFRQNFSDCQHVWRKRKKEIQRALLDESLKKNVYPPKSIEGNWIPQLEQYFRSTEATMPSFFEKLTPLALQKGAKKDKIPPEHPFFNACESLLARWNELESLLKRRKAELMVQVCAEVQEECKQRKNEMGLKSYHDLLADCSRSLRNSPLLGKEIRSKTKALLVDEFQDTDPLQYEILELITHDDSFVVFVGDPKQSIYSFRGADIFTYLRASKEPSLEKHSLKTNYRSRKELVLSMNHLFGIQEKPFLIDEIHYHEQSSGKPNSEHEQASNVNGGLHFHVPSPDFEENKSRTELEALAADWVRKELFRFNKKKQGDRQLGLRIAILCRSNDEVEALSQSLSSIHVPHRKSNQNSAFESECAVGMKSLLDALTHLDDEKILRRALLLEPFSLNYEELYPERDLGKWKSLFRKWFQLWKSKGIAFCLTDIFETLTRGKLPLSSPCLFDKAAFLSLTEIVAECEFRKKVPPRALALWFQKMLELPHFQERELSSRQKIIRGGDQGVDQWPMQIEVMTIHKSKGLEFDFVFCPFLWKPFSLTQLDKRYPSFHDETKSQPFWVDLNHPPFETSLELAYREKFSEELRLLYVALTRAKHECHIFYASPKDARKSPLYSMLGEQNLRTLVEASCGAIQVNSVDSLGSSEDAWKEESSEIIFKPWKNRVIRSDHASSFSSIIASGHSSLEILKRTVPSEEMRTLGQVVHEQETQITLRGKKVGNLVHTILEKIPFEVEKRAERDALIEQLCKEYSFDNESQFLIQQWITNTLEVPISNQLHSFSLKEIERNSQLREMPFQILVRNAHFNVHSLGDLLLKHSFPAFEPRYGKKLNQITNSTLGRFLSGFIDLVVCVHGCWYIIDYKSNYLEGYDTLSLKSTLIEHDYLLQALLYTFALHLYLEKRLPHYNYARDFGGVYFLFPRGMDVENRDRGVCFERPSSELIHEFSHLIAG